MTPKSNIIPKILLGIVLFTGASFAYSYYSPLLRPCSRPIEYSLDRIDPGFGMSQAEFLSAIQEAEATWEQPTGLDLFDHSVGGDLEISFIYDYRQQATDKLSELGGEIDSSRKSYELLRAQYKSQLASYNSLKAEIASLSSQYESKKRSYESRLKSWDPKKGSQSEYDSLKKQADELNSLANQINAKRDQLNQLANSINSTVNLLNKMVADLNLDVAKYNQIGASTGSEFEEGVHIRDASGHRIEIYEFDNRDQLIRVLAHELGHALGMGHVEDEDAIMFRLNTSDNQTPTAADLLELNETCRR